MADLVYFRNSLFLCLLLLMFNFTSFNANKLKIISIKNSISNHEDSYIESNFPNRYDQDYDFFNAKLPICNSKTCLNKFGQCTSSTNCKCFKGWANTKISQTSCDYLQKNQLTPFLLELFLNMGIGHFYIESWWLGALKMIILLIVPAILCILLFALKFFKTHLWWWTAIVFLTTSFVWWFIDLILFGTNNYNDGNGVPLLSW